MLDLGDDALHAAQCVGLVRKHRRNARDDIAFVLPRRTKITGRDVCHRLLHDAFALDEIIEALFRGVDIAVQKLDGRGKELFAWEENVPARLAVVGKFEG